MLTGCAAGTVCCLFNSQPLLLNYPQAWRGKSGQVSEDWASVDWSAVDGPSLESSSLSGLDLDSWVLDFQIGLLLTFWMLATTMQSVLLVGLGTQ